jgi:hypothetical protein
MKISRRNFIQGTALLGPASAVVSLAFLSPPTLTHAAVVAGPFLLRPPADGADMSRVVFRIDGWDRHEEIAIDRSIAPSPDSVDDTPPDHEMWLRINQSWRATWR